MQENLNKLHNFEATVQPVPGYSEVTLSPWYQTYSLFQYLGMVRALPSSQLLGGDTESLVPDLLPVSVSGHRAGPSQFPATRR